MKSGRGSFEPDPSRIAWVHGIKFLIIVNRRLLLGATFIHRKRTISANQMPFFIVVSGRLARYNGVLADLVVLTLRGPFVDLVGAVRMTGVLLVQCPAGKFAPVKTWRLLCLRGSESGWRPSSCRPWRTD